MFFLGAAGVERLREFLAVFVLLQLTDSMLLDLTLLELIVAGDGEGDPRVNVEKK